MHTVPTMPWPAESDTARLDAGRGALVVAGDGPTSVVLVVACDDAVGVALAARDLLAAEGIEASVVAILDPVTFAGQEMSYRDQVLPAVVPRVDMSGLTAQAAAVDARRQLRRRR